MIRLALLTIAILLIWVYDARISPEECLNQKGIHAYGICMSQLTAYRTVERWPNYGGHPR